MDYDLFQTFHDLHLSKEARDDMLRYGVSSENTRKLRTDTNDKDDSTDAKEVAMATLYGTKYCIPLDHPILLNHGVFYPKGLSHPLKFEITLGSVSDIVVYSDTTKPPNYKITNLELEYRSISVVDRRNYSRDFQFPLRINVKISEHAQNFNVFKPRLVCRRILILPSGSSGNSQKSEILKNLKFSKI